MAIRHVTREVVIPRSPFGEPVLKCSGGCPWHTATRAEVGQRLFNGLRTAQRVGAAARARTGFQRLTLVGGSNLSDLPGVVAALAGNRQPDHRPPRMNNQAACLPCLLSSSGGVDEPGKVYLSIYRLAAE